METNTFPLELLTNDNYADWSVKMKNKLLAQDLWDIVETGLEPPKPNDDELEYEVRRKKNDEALHTIQSSCGMDMLSRINNISSSKIAWKVLGKISMKSNGQENLIQTKDDKSIIDEGDPSSSHNPGPERADDYIYKPLLEAVQSGNWNDTKEFLEAHPAALTADILTRGGTVLHAAVEVEQEDIVDELVKMIPEGDLRKQDRFGFTALHQATVNGNQRMAECLITKNRSLVSITSNSKPALPVSLAMSSGHKELARYLYSQTPLEDLARHGASLLFHCIYNRDLDMALDLMERCPSLAFACDRSDISPLEVLANNSTEAFESGKGMVFWKQWIYNYCRHDISLADLALAADQFRLNVQNHDQENTTGSDLALAADQFRLNVQNHGQENTTGSVGADLWRQLVSSLFNLLGFKRLYEIKLVRAKFQQLLDVMCRASQRSPEDNDILCRAMFSAIKRGNFEYVHHIIKANPDFLWLAVERNMFQWAVLHRQHRIFSLIYSLKQMNVLVPAVDSSGNNMLHMAGMVIVNTAIDSIRGAALQMQREVQWFKEVERICPPSHKEKLNKDKLTPRQLFRRDHQNMRKEGEKWMKGTATSCTVVGALIMTIMFAAVFTIPGGNHQVTGLPILMHDKLFKLFIVTDSLSLFSSSTSILMFLGILTSRYAEEDFLRSLPRKMIIGLFTLFFSIATMMIAFSAALLPMLRGKYRIVVPIISLAGIPVILFVLVQSRLLVEMFNSTYRPGIFDRKMKPWLTRHL